MQIVVAILLFSLLVVVHELGHFLMAKAGGIEVQEFSIGMGPRIVTFVRTDEGVKGKLFLSGKEYEARKEWEGRTKYSIKIFPIGGSCIMLGEDEEVENENAFNKKSVFTRASVLFGGPAFNFIFAFILSLILVGAVGYDPPTVVSVEEGMPVAEAGVEAGDRIVELNGTNIYLDREISTFLQFNPLGDEPITVAYERDGQEGEVTVTPRLTQDEDGNEAYRLGFSFGSGRVKANAWETVKYAMHEIRFYIVTTVKSVGLLITGGMSKDDLAGPVGIVDMVGDAMTESKKVSMFNMLMTLLNFCILLGANLGVMNLLPLPALDGGRLLFLAIEWIRGKPSNREVEGWINLIGFVALMLLMVFVLYNDVVRIATGG